MTLQVVNTTIEKFNQIRTTTETLFKDVKERGWNMKDCKITELYFPSSAMSKIYFGSIFVRLKSFGPCSRP